MNSGGLNPWGRTPLQSAPGYEHLMSLVAVEVDEPVASRLTGELVGHHLNR